MPTLRFSKIKPLIVPLINKLKITEIRTHFDQLCSTLTTGDRKSIGIAASRLLRLIDKFIYKITLKNKSLDHDNFLTLLMLKNALSSWEQDFKTPTLQLDIQTLLAQDKKILIYIKEGLLDISDDVTLNYQVIQLLINLQQAIFKLEELTAPDISEVELLHHYIANLKIAFENAVLQKNSSLFLEYCKQETERWVAGNPIQILNLAVKAPLPASEEENILAILYEIVGKLPQEDNLENDLHKCLNSILAGYYFSKRIINLGVVLNIMLSKFDDMFFLQHPYLYSTVGYEEIKLYWLATHFFVKNLNLDPYHAQIVLGICRFAVQISHRIGQNSPLLIQETIFPITSQANSLQVTDSLKNNTVRLLQLTISSNIYLSPKIPFSFQIIKLYSEILHSRWNGIVNPEQNKAREYFGCIKKTTAASLMIVAYLIYVLHFFGNIFIPSLTLSLKANKKDNFSQPWLICNLLLYIFVSLFVFITAANIFAPFPELKKAQSYSNIIASLQKKFSLYEMPFPEMNEQADTQSISSNNVRLLLTALEMHLLEKLNESLTKTNAPTPAPIAPGLRFAVPY